MSGSIRQGNLSRVLTLVHRRGPLSRAELTELTGLNRSTIGALIADLCAAGLLVEGPALGGRIGRPSPVVRTSADVVAIAANPEVDAVDIAEVRLDGSVGERIRIDVERVPSADEAVRIVATQVERWRGDALADRTVVGIGLAIPGLVRASDGLVRRAPHLDWTDAPVRAMLQDATGLPVAVENDATAGAVAEQAFGGARGVDDFVYLNGGASGIGGGVVVGGVPVRGAGGYAGEFGRNRPGIGADADASVAGGVLEDEVSRRRLADVLEVVGLSDVELAGAVVDTTEPGAIEEIERQRRILATALANVVNVLNPSLILLGGFLAGLAERDRAGLARLVAEQTLVPGSEGLTIRAAELARDRLLIGAAVAAFAPLLAAPASPRA